MEPSRPPTAWWLPGPHLQTLWGKLGRRQTPIATRVERWDTLDGDFLDIHRLAFDPDAPRVVMLHGLEGSVRSHYAQGLLAECARHCWNVDFMTFRSCGEALNRKVHSYHSGETKDLAFVLDRIESQHPHAPVALVGVSLGGNVVLKYLGERGAALSPNIIAAAAISVPFDLAVSAEVINRGFSRVYQRFFLRTLRAKAIAKARQHGQPKLIRPVSQVETLRAFDDLVTAPFHGFRDASHYYRESSSIHYLANIRTKTLLISAIDDPFLRPEVFARVRNEIAGNEHIEVDFLARGGHVGFVHGRAPWHPIYYMEGRIGSFLDEVFHRPRRHLPPWLPTSREPRSDR